MPYDNSTGTYTPPNVSGYFPDLYNFGPDAPQYQQRTRKPQFTTRVVDKLAEGEIVAWRLILEDTQGGLNLTQGRFDLDYDRVSSSTLDTRWYNTLVNCQLTTQQTSPVFTSPTISLSSAMFNDLLHVGFGGAANLALFKETSSTNPAMAAITYSPVSAISSLTPTIFNGTAYLIAGDVAGVAHAFTAAYANTAMDASTTGLWGACQTFVNSNQLMLYAADKIRLMPTTGLVTAAATTALTGLPQGGNVLGLVKLAGAPVRVAMLWPTVSVGVPAVVGGRVVTVNQEATEYQLVPTGLDKVYGAIIINDSMIVAHNRRRITLYDGRSTARDLFWLSQREANSDLDVQVVGLGQNGQEVLAHVMAGPGLSSTGTTYYSWLESYNLQTNAWHQITATQNLGALANDLTTTLNSSLAFHQPIGIPLSTTTGFAQSTNLFRSGGSNVPAWYRTFIPPYGYNPYNQLRQTSGAGSSTGYEFESTGTYTSPYFALPGLEGAPFMVDRITFMGDLDSGGTSGTAASISVTAGNLTTSFMTGFGRRAQEVDMADTGEAVYQLQISITQTRNTGSTRWTPNGLPLMIEGYAWVSKLRPPFGWLNDGR